jgi:hypothetical protein
MYLYSHKSQEYYYYNILFCVILKHLSFRKLSLFVYLYERFIAVNDKIICFRLRQIIKMNLEIQ